jgi:hypothetical protein
VAVRKVAAHSCLTLIIKELKISVEHNRVVTTLNIIFSLITTFSVVHWLVFPTYASLCRLLQVGHQVINNANETSD